MHKSNINQTQTYITDLENDVSKEQCIMFYFLRINKYQLYPIIYSTLVTFPHQNINLSEICL